MNGDKELQKAVFEIREHLATLTERINSIIENQREIKGSVDRTCSDMKYLGVRSAENRKDIEWNKWGVRAMILGLVGLALSHLADLSGLY